MKIEFIASQSVTEAPEALAVLAMEEGGMSSAAHELDSATGGSVRRAIAASRFKGKAGQTLDLLAPAGVKAGRALIVGAGAASELTADGAESFAAQAYQSLKLSGAHTVWLMLPGVAASVAAQAAFGARLAAYRFDLYRTKDSEDKKPSINHFVIVCDDPKAAKKLAAPLGGLAEGIEFTRDLVSEPANILYPEEFAKRVKKLEKHGLEVEIIGEKEMKDRKSVV